MAMAKIYANLIVKGKYDYTEVMNREALADQLELKIQTTVILINDKKFFTLEDVLANEEVAQEIKDGVVAALGAE